MHQMVFNKHIAVLAYCPFEGKYESLFLSFADAGDRESCCIKYHLIWPLR